MQRSRRYSAWRTPTNRRRGSCSASRTNTFRCARSSLRSGCARRWRTIPSWERKRQKVWDDVAAAYKLWTPNEEAYQVLERPAAQGSSLFRLARILVRLGEERSKPSGQRLAEFRESGMKTLELAIESRAPVDDGMETALLAQYLEEVKALGEAADPLATAGQRARTRRGADSEPGRQLANGVAARRPAWRLGCGRRRRTACPEAKETYWCSTTADGQATARRTRLRPAVYAMRSATTRAFWRSIPLRSTSSGNTRRPKRASSYRWMPRGSIVLSSAAHNACPTAIR